MTAQIDDLVKRFCFGNIKNIELAMLRRERGELEKLKNEILEHVKRAEEKKEELVRLKNEIEAERKLASEQVLRIFTEMKPEAAASQFNTMDENKARAVLGRLNPKIASAILNEMQPKKAAALAEGLLARQGTSGK